MYMYVAISREYRTGEGQFGGISLTVRVSWHVINLSMVVFKTKCVNQRKYSFMGTDVQGRGNITYNNC